MTRPWFASAWYADAWYADAYPQKFHLEAGHNILVSGASGAIGTAAVQLAKSYGAKVTTIVATRHLDLAVSLGANSVVDDTVKDFTQVGESFDFVLDAVGKTTFFRCRKYPFDKDSAGVIKPTLICLTISKSSTIVRGATATSPASARRYFSNRQRQRSNRHLKKVQIAKETNFFDAVGVIETTDGNGPSFYTTQSDFH